MNNFTAFELGVIAVALVELRRSQKRNVPVLDAVMSIASKLGIEQTISQGGKGWHEFHGSLVRDLEGGAA